MKKYLAFFSLFFFSLFSNPEQPTTVQGDIQISSFDKQLQIQASNGSIINWKTFSIAEGELTKFIQPTSDSSVLNRVLGTCKSEILGKLESNGSILLLNPNGILIGKDARIDTAGFLASTLNLSDEDFLKKKEQLFKGNSQESIENLGTIHTSTGNVTLLAHIVKNNGHIETPLGKVTIGAGLEILLQPENTDKIFIRASLPEDLIENKGKIEAFQTELKADGNPYAKAIKIDGQLSTPMVISRGGKILISSGEASCEIGGSLQTDNGEIQISASGIHIEKQAILSASKGDISIVGKRLNNEGTILAQEGSFTLECDSLIHLGTLDVSGKEAGSIYIDTLHLLNAGKMMASSSFGKGGNIHLYAKDSFIETSAAFLSVNGKEGGEIFSEVGKSRLFTSASYEALGQTKGGKIRLLGTDICLAALQINASGQEGGGEILIGGDIKGSNPNIQNASILYVNGASNIRADAICQGDGGKIILWSDGKTEVYGDILCRGGKESGNGGFVEVSGKEHLICQAQITNTALHGKAGTLLLDPTNLVIDNTTGIYAQYQFINPDPGGGGTFGESVVSLSTGNIVITNTGCNSNVGVAYLFNGKTAALISALRGSISGDNVGYSIALPSGDYLVTSSQWHFNIGTPAAGAVTFCSGVTGVSGVVSAANSLVGNATNDGVGNGGITILTNGNYVVQSSSWHGGIGAATFVNGTTGIPAAETSPGAIVSSTNSLVGSVGGDLVSNTGVVPLTNGNYVVKSAPWNGFVGAATWGSGVTGVTGVVSVLNSLIGQIAGDSVGEGAYALTNGNYVVISSSWGSGRGAATFVNGTTGIPAGEASPGANVSFSNSLVGDPSDRVGLYGVTALTNGNYVVLSPAWKGFAIAYGAATFVNGTSGIPATEVSPGVTVSSSNSLVGSSLSDRVGSEVFALSNGNYVVASSAWNNLRGAVTWGDGVAGITGVVSGLNSLVGSIPGDTVGRVTLLTNENYVVSSPAWNGVGVSSGAVTFVNGTTGIPATEASPGASVSITNSLVGGSASDSVGLGVIALSNGNYVVRSPIWRNAGVLTGAATLVNGTTGVPAGEALPGAFVSSSNSLVGSSSNDQISSGGVTALPNGNYVVRSPLWNNIGAPSAGAATFVNGTTGVPAGEILPGAVVSSSNSLVGSSPSDRVTSGGVIVLSNENYVVRSPLWNNIGAPMAGAATFGLGNTGITGIVSPANSLVGSIAHDQVSDGGVIASLDGTYVVSSPFWNNGLFNSAGAVTFCKNNGTTFGSVTPQNSVVGQMSFTDLLDIVLDNVNQTFICPFISENSTGVIRVGLEDPNQIDYLRAQAQSITTTSSFITDTLDLGINVVLQALNDITINSPLASAGAANLTFQAAGSLFINADINIPNGNLNVVVDSLSVPPNVSPISQLVIGPGVTIVANKSGFWTAMRASNSIDPTATINGTSFSPGTFGVNTPQEVWETYFPSGTINPSSPFFTFFYEEKGIPPSPPQPQVISEQTIIRAQNQSAPAWGEFFSMLHPFNEYIWNYIWYENEAIWIENKSYFPTFSKQKIVNPKENFFLRRGNYLIEGLQEKGFKY